MPEDFTGVNFTTINTADKETITIGTANGDIAPVARYVVVAAFSGTADNLDRIETSGVLSPGDADGAVLYLRADAGDTITIRHDQNAGQHYNILTEEGHNVILTGERVLRLAYDIDKDTDGAWVVESRQIIRLIADGNDEDALELLVDAAGFGDIKALDIVYDTGAIVTGEDEAIILVDINEFDANGGEVFGLEVLATDGGADAIYAMKAGAVVGPLLQESGVFINPTTGTNDTESTDVPDMIDGSTGTNTTIFAADNDYIIIGNVATFTEIEFNIETPASNPGIKPTFEYSITGTHQFTTFSPVDGTNGFRNSGVIAWDAADLIAHVADAVTTTFDIKITRTHAVAGNVSLFYAKTAATVVFKWDKDGRIFSEGLVVGHTVQAADHLLELAVMGTGNVDTAALLARYSANAFSASLRFVKSRGSINAAGIVSDNDAIGGLHFYVSDATDTKVLAAVFEALVDDASPASNDIGAEFLWSSMPGGEGDPGTRREVMRLAADGTLTLGAAKLQIDSIADASVTAQGVIEVATAAEINTGTDATRAVSPDSLAGSDLGRIDFEVTAFAPATNTATGDGKAFLHITDTVDGMNLVYVHAAVFTEGTTGTLTVAIRRTRGDTPGGATTIDMLSTNITVDTGEYGSHSAATPAVINASNDDAAEDDFIIIDVDGVHSGTAAKGLVVTLGFRKP